MDGSALHLDAGLLGADRRGKLAALHVALLARPAAQGTHRRVRRLLVFEPDPRPHRRQPYAGADGPAHRPDQPLRADAGQRGRAGAEVLVPPHQGRPEAPPAGAGKGSQHGLAGDQVELGSSQDLRQAAGGGRPRAAHDQHALGALDHHRGRGRPLPLADDRQDHPRRHPPAPCRRRQADNAGGAADHAEHRRARRAHRTQARPQAADQEGIRGAAGAVAGPPGGTGARSALQGTLGGLRLRRLGCRRQGRQHPPHHRGARCPPVPDRPGRRPHRGRARPALPVALLAPHSAQRPPGDLRPHLVRPRAGRARRRILRRGRLAARLFGNQRLRARSRLCGRHRDQVLAADRQGRAAAALQGAREDRVQALQDHRRGLAQPREVG